MTSVRKNITFCILLSFVMATACKHTQPNEETALSEMNKTLQQSIKSNHQIANHPGGFPTDVQAALTPSVHSDSFERGASDRRFNLVVNNMPAGTFFMGLTKETAQNMIVDSDLEGTISLQLKNVTLEDVLNMVQETYGYNIEKVPFGYRVSKSDLKTEIYSLNYLDVSREGKTETVVNGGQPTSTNKNTTAGTVSPLDQSTTGQPNQSDQANSSSIQTTSKSDFWKLLDKTLKTMVGSQDGHSVVINSAAGIVIVRAYPKEQHQIREYLNSLETNMTRQVILEAKILDVELSNNYQTGINWNIFGASQQFIGTGVVDSAQQIIPDTAPTNAFVLNITSGNAFATVVKMLATEGNVQVLSSPRVATLNNQKAVIKVGNDRYFVTGVTNTTTATTGSNPQNAENIELTPFFSGIALDVTPEIDENGDVILHVHPTISNVTDDNRSVTLQGGTVNLPTAQSDIRESDSIVRAKSGQVIVIGGLMKTENGENLKYTPFLGRMPFIGAIFRNTLQQAKKSELVILLKPTVVKPNTWTKELQVQQKNLRKYARGFHVGERSETFGNFGEKTPNWMKH